MCHKTKSNQTNTWNRLTKFKQMTDVKIELLVLDSNTWNYLTVCKQIINTKLNY